jgi:hypothetical protein
MGASIIDVEFHTWSFIRYGGFYNRCGVPYMGVPKDMWGYIIDVEFHTWSSKRYVGFYNRCGVPYMESHKRCGVP